MTHKISWLALIALTMVIVLVLSCDDDDGPVGPRPVKDYAIYFSDASYGDRYFRYHTATGVVDTLTIPYSSYDGMAVSADGKLLYLSDNDKTVVLTTDSLEFVTEIASSTRYAVIASPDNRLLAIAGDDLSIVEASGHAVIYNDSECVYHAVFSLSSQSLYGVGSHDTAFSKSPYAYRVELDQVPPRVSRKVFESGSSWLVIPSVDESRWFMLLKFDTFGYMFSVYDRTLDSTLFERLTTPGAGDIEVTPDGRLAFFTNPGTLLIGPPPAPFLYAFDIANNRVMDSVYTPSPVNGSMIPRLLAITPDGKTLIAAGARGQGEFSVIDVRTLTVVEHHYLGNTVDFWDVACQNGR